MKTKDPTLIRKGKGFGPFRRFRIDLHQEGETFTAKGYDAEQPDAEGHASVFAASVNADPEQAQIDCQRIIEASPEWLDAHTLADKAWEPNP